LKQGLIVPSYVHPIVFLMHPFVSSTLFHIQNPQAPKDMVVNHPLCLEKKNVD
jgi:hypothetical protein